MASYIGEPNGTKRRIFKVREVGEGFAFRLIRVREGRLVVEDAVNFLYLRDASGTVWARVGSDNGYITHFYPEDCCVKATVKEQLDANGVVLVKFEEVPTWSEVIAYRFNRAGDVEKEEHYRVVAGRLLRPMTGHAAYTVFHDFETVRFHIVVPAPSVFHGPLPGRRLIDV